MNRLLDYIFPRTCHLCGTTLPGASKDPICRGCLSRLPRTLYHRRHDNPMTDRFAGHFPFERASGHFCYSAGSELSELIQDLKYRRFRKLAVFLGKVIGTELLPTGFLSDIDLIIPIPIHYMKKARRGYNQTEELARGLSEATGIPAATPLRAIRPHRSQTALTPEQRTKNLSDVFSLSAKPTNPIEGRHILLLDDVCTTGSTLSAAASVILAASPSTRLSMLTAGVTF